MKSINPEKLAWKKCFENDGLISFQNLAYDNAKLTYNKIGKLWFILIEMGEYVPVFVGKINTNKELEFITSNVCLDRNKISSILKTK